jgi:hypothetical protein
MKFGSIQYLYNKSKDQIRAKIEIDYKDYSFIHHLYIKGDDTEMIKRYFLHAKMLNDL